MAATKPEQGVPGLGWQAGSTLGMDLFLHWMIAVSAFCGPCPGELITPEWGCAQGELHSSPPGLAEAAGSWVLTHSLAPHPGWSPQVDAGGGRTLQIRALQHPVSWGQTPTMGRFRRLPRNRSVPLLPFHCSSSLHPSWLLQLQSLAVYSRVGRNPHAEGQQSVGVGEGVSRQLPAPTAPWPPPQLLLAAPN